MTDATSTFSPPRSPLTRLGKPSLLTASRNAVNIVSASLLLAQRRYIARLLYPSMQPFMMNLHLRNELKHNLHSIIYNSPPLCPCSAY